MRYVAVLGAGPNAVPGRPVHEQDPAIMRAHLEHMRRHYEEGSVLFGGPFRSSFGGIALIEAGDLAAARAIVEADPAVARGIIAFDLHGVRPYFDAFAGLAWAPSGNDAVEAALQVPGALMRPA
ncbi:YciI family protein [Chelatococcus reniformis]|uniref:YCII-related domain-containing protein n=1 Tax=Chelatococcus reniformis TaxID=1494448 RepID=A0A916U8T1_9HYPH|nr:YciI family protein [Chelatococcus reniformis]GGC62247.1 hypothetical protein GCM10010994_21040 [Chelatococcus reniformis]